MNALSCGFFESILRRAASATARAETRFARTASAISHAESSSVIPVLRRPRADPSGSPALRVELLVAFEHVNKADEAASAGLRLLCVLEPIEDGVAVGAVQGFEERSRLRVSLELALQVVGDFDRALGCVGGPPAAVSF